LKNESEMAKKKAEISKEPQDVQTWREKAAVVRRELFHLRNKHSKIF
jgi:hypothetical protein